MTLTASLPLTIYYDHSCPLCRKEMLTLKDHDVGGALRLVDCSVPGFKDAEVDRAGFRTGELMVLIHARDAAGRWFLGVDVFVLAYRAVGIDAVAGLWANRWLRPVWDRAYPWVARHRQGLSRIGFTTAFGWLVAWSARRAVARAQGCKDDICERP